MATKFLEPGGDATFNVAATTGGGFWKATNVNVSVVTDFVHGSHIKSIKYAPNTSGTLNTPTGTIQDSGTRISFYLYINAMPNATSIIATPDNVGNVWQIELKSTGVVILTGNARAQMGSDGPTLVTGRWYRISLAYTIASLSVNRFELFVDGTSAVSVTNSTLGNTGTSNLRLGNTNSNATLDIRTSDHYIDDSSSLSDTGDIWVTAKRPISNGSANNFTTQIGSGGSGYGTGHAPQVNERPLSTTNGWSDVNLGARSENYTIEGRSVGDINIKDPRSIVDFVGWIYASSSLSETAQIVVDTQQTNISLTSTNTMFTQAAGEKTYPVGTSDIGINSDATVTTVNIYECGIMVAFTPMPYVNDMKAMFQ